MKHIRETHRIHRVGWLRAAVLGANDGIISTASLLIGVAAANTSHQGVLIAGVAGLIAGSMSMAAGEYVSVSSQSDTEKAELLIEKKELEENPEFEKVELTAIYEERGLTHELARQVADQLMEHDALAAHARDELGITDTLKARPFQAALSSALSFSLGAALPLLVTILTPEAHLIRVIFISTFFFLILLGGLAAKIGGSKPVTSILRILIWGSAAMLLTASIGSIFGI